MKEKTKRYLYLILHVVICIASMAILPISVYLAEIPSWVTIVSCVITILSFVFLSLIALKTKGTRFAMAMVTLLTVILSLAGNYCNPYWNSIGMKRNIVLNAPPLHILSREDAIEDLNYAMYYLEKLHPACYSKVPEEVALQYERISNELQSESMLPVCELNRKLESILSILQDGHTYVSAMVKEPHYRKDIETLNQRNYKLVAINGISLDRLMEQTKELYSFEAESWQLEQLKTDLATLEGLQYLGFATERGTENTYETEDGTTESQVYQETDFITYEEYVAYNKLEENKASKPFVSYEIAEDKSLAILTLNSCRYNEEYRSCLKEMFTKVKESGIQNVAVDLRSNGGGDSRVADEFIRYLDVDHYHQGSNRWRFGCFWIPLNDKAVENKKYEEWTFDGEVYLLTSSASFSSAMLFAQYIKDNGLGTLIGEAPGNNPNGYGEIASFVLPNSRMYLQISTKQFYRVDQSTSDFLIEPDISCDSDEAVEVLYQKINAKETD